MSRIFLSHSSVDELEAVALQQWMAAALMSGTMLAV